VIVDGVGLEFVEHRRWWRPGQHRLLGWEEVQAISASHADFTESTGKRAVTRSRPVLEIYLYREVADLPEFAAAVADKSSALDGLRTPTYRIRVGGPGGAYEGRVRELADVIGRVRPDAFYQGIAVDQWFAPPARSADRTPEPEPQPAPNPEPVGPSRAGAEPVWIDKSSTPGKQVGFTLLTTLVFGVSLAAILNPFPQPWQVIVGWLGMVPFLATAVMLPFAIVLLPRFVATRAVRIDAAGLEFVQDTMWWYRRKVHQRVPWSAVQAIVARSHFIAGDGDERGYRPLRGRPESAGTWRAAPRTGIRAPVIDIYLRGETWPGRFIQEVTASRHQQPDSVGTGTLVTFPATRLRVRFRRYYADLRSALYAHRPDLCHGFKDAAETSIGGGMPFEDRVVRPLVDPGEAPGR
jgi:hypothetical protein